MGNILSNPSWDRHASPHEIGYVYAVISSPRTRRSRRLLPPVPECPPRETRSPPFSWCRRSPHARYLVHSLRDWLTRKQKETRRGRAELLLADRAAVWNARPENRQLPSLSQWLNIGWLSTRKNWTPPQTKMMAKAGRYHVVRALVACRKRPPRVVAPVAPRPRKTPANSAQHPMLRRNSLQRSGPSDRSSSLSCCLHR